MEKLNKLIQRCKCGVYLTINSHRDIYETVEQHFENKSKYDIDLKDDIDKDVFEKMKEQNTIIELQYYPNNPNGFYILYHYDLEMILDEALTSLNI